MTPTAGGLRSRACWSQSVSLLAADQRVDAIAPAAGSLGGRCPTLSAPTLPRPMTGSTAPGPSRCSSWVVSEFVRVPQAGSLWAEAKTTRWSASTMSHNTPSTMMTASKRSIPSASPRRGPGSPHPDRAFRARTGDIVTREATDSFDLGPRTLLEAHVGVRPSGAPRAQSPTKALAERVVYRASPLARRTASALRCRFSSTQHSMQWRCTGDRRSSIWWHLAHSNSANFGLSRERPGRGIDISLVGVPRERSKWRAPAHRSHCSSH
jgi:hypothetical protein